MKDIESYSFFFMHAYFFIKVRTYNVDQTKNLRSLNPDGEFLAVDILQNDGISAIIISVKLVTVMTVVIC